MTPDAREQARHKASVMIAFAEGKAIQVGPLDGQGPWTDYSTSHFDGPTWDFPHLAYRVKPEERKPRLGTMWAHDDYPELQRSHGHSSDDAARMAGWSSVKVSEVLPSENTGGQDD